MLKKDKPNKAILALKAYAEMTYNAHDNFWEVMEAFENSCKPCIDLFYSYDMVFDTILFEYLEVFRGSNSEFYLQVRACCMDDE